jgi:acetyl-CoA C-acetyltransferase
MLEAFIVEAVRTPMGRKNGTLAAIHPADLAAEIMRETVARARIDPAAVDDVIWGCLDQVGPQSANVARTAWLAAGLPESVPAVTIDRACGSSQQAIHFAVQAVLSGTQDLVLVGGSQSMNIVPLTITWGMLADRGYPTPTARCAGWQARYGDQEITQFRGAELIAEQWGISREQMEIFALESNARALRAVAEGRFVREIVPVAGLRADETPRADTSLEKMAALKPLRDGGRITAALASQIADGASALLIASRGALMTHNLTPRARIYGLTVVGDDPVRMLTGPIPATRRVLKQCGLALEDIDAIEINEAFASVVLAWSREFGADLSKVNVNGGAIALGHPLGATGARLATSLLHELERTNGRFGLETICEGGGQANAMVIERL